MFLSQITGALYRFVREEDKSLKSGSPSKQGYDFEDRASRRIHDLVNGYGVVKRPPRTELEYPSFSGIRHPFDNSFLHEKVIYPIECKATAHQVEHLYAFNAKIIDHALGIKIHDIDLQMRGIFLSTAELGQTGRAYALAYGMIPIDPTVPPIDYMIESVRDDDLLKEQLQKLREKTTAYLPDILSKREKRDGIKLEETLNQLYHSWKSRGYV